MSHVRRYGRDEMFRRKLYRLAFVKKHIDKFIEADKYAEKNNIRHGYDWAGHLRSCPAIKFIFAELKKVIYYAPSLNGGRDDVRIDIWHTLYAVCWKKRVKPTIKTNATGIIKS